MIAALYCASSSEGYGLGMRIIAHNSFVAAQIRSCDCGPAEPGPELESKMHVYYRMSLRSSWVRRAVLLSTYATSLSRSCGKITKLSETGYVPAPQGRIWIVTRYS